MVRGDAQIDREQVEVQEVVFEKVESQAKNAYPEEIGMQNEKRVFVEIKTKSVIAAADVV